MATEGKLIIPGVGTFIPDRMKHLSEEEMRAIYPELTDEQIYILLDEIDKIS